ARVTPAEQAAWQVRLLGRFELDDGRQCLTRLRSRAAMALVARLAMSPNRDHGREELAALLWPEADADVGRSRLRQTLSLLRAVLEPPGASPLILADRRTIRSVAGAFWCDAVAFEQHLRAGQAAQARACYGGELMPGFYDEWVGEERARLQALADWLPEAPLGSGLAGQPPLAAPASALSGSPAGTRAVAVGDRLPHYLTRLVGADQQGARLQAQTQEHRLVVVLGAGGSGKTRLAIEVARSLVQVMPGAAPPRFERVVFVSLVGAVTATDLLDRLALALRMKSSGDVAESLLEVLEGRHLLLLLDNAEELDSGAAGTVAHLAERLPDAHLLVTSRRPLNVDGERRFRMHALELPPAGASVTEVTMNAAVALFVDRARAHQPDFHVHAGTAADVVGLVRWLEGLPLAIELAASRVRTLAPAELLGMLEAARAESGVGESRDEADDAGTSTGADTSTSAGAGASAGSFALLARHGGRSGSDPRHASMLAVMAWSWHLLGAEQRRLLFALCVLPAGAAVDIAAALASDDGAIRFGIGAVQALLDELVEQSVVMAGVGQDGRRRYAPIEAVREYGLSRLGAVDSAQHRVRVRLAYLDWARAMPATPLLPSVRDEMPNLMVALASAPGDADGNAALQLVLLLQSSWGEMAVPAGVLESLDRLLATSGLDDALAAGVHALAASAHQDAGRPDDVRRHREAALARPCADPAIRAMVLSRMARMTWRVDKDHARARDLIEMALPLARAAQRPNTEASLLSLQGHLATVVDRDPERGKQLSAAALALWARSGNEHLINNGRYNVAVQTTEAGAPERALGEFDALIEAGRRLHDWDLAAGSYEARGTALFRLRRWAGSAASLREGLELAWDNLELQAALHALWNIPPALLRLGHADLAVQTMGCAEAQWQQRYGAFDARDRRDLRRMRRYARARLGAAGADAAWRTGARLPLADAVRRVLLETPRHPL
ncbi:MAG: AAA family ATPase, partial [Caldimonas sp.]